MTSAITTRPARPARQSKEWGWQPDTAFICNVRCRRDIRRAPPNAARHLTLLPAKFPGVSKGSVAELLEVSLHARLDDIERVREDRAAQTAHH